MRASTPQHRPAARDRSDRAADRGAAVFIVVLVLALLTAIGVFAVRSASLVDVASGYNRQAMQTVYLAELAGRSATTHVGRAPGQYVQQMQTNPELCETTKLVPDAGGGLPSCYKIYSTEIEGSVQQQYTGATLLEPQLVDEAGSLGPQLSFDDATSVGRPLEGVFVVELTDPHKGQLQPGSNANGEGFRDVQVTLTAYGQTRSVPPGGATNPWCSDSAVSSSASIQALRAHVTLPNVER